MGASVPPGSVSRLPLHRPPAVKREDHGEHVAQLGRGLLEGERRVEHAQPERRPPRVTASISIRQVLVVDRGDGRPASGAWLDLRRWAPAPVARTTSAGLVAGQSLSHVGRGVASRDLAGPEP